MICCGYVKFAIANFHLVQLVIVHSDTILCVGCIAAILCLDLCKVC